MEYIKEKDFDEWAEARKESIYSFILLRGLVAWGLPMFIAITFFVNDAFDESGLIVSHVVINAVAWTIGGLFFGASIWYFTERKYKKELANRKET